MEDSGFLESTSTVHPKSGNATEYADDDYYFDYELYYSHWQYQWYVNLFMYVSPFLIVLGTVGNILNLIVLQSRLYRNSPCSVTLSTLALVDMAVLNIGLLRLWIVVMGVMCIY